MVTGTLVSAKEKEVNSTQTKVVKKKQAKKKSAVKAENRPVSDGNGCDHWADVISSCGTVFYLCADHYNTLTEFIEDARYFDSVKC